MSGRVVPNVTSSPLGCLPPLGVGGITCHYPKRKGFRSERPLPTPHAYFFFAIETTADKRERTESGKLDVGAAQNSQHRSDGRQ